MRLIENAERENNKIIDSAPFPSTDVDKVSNLLKMNFDSKTLCFLSEGAE